MLKGSSISITEDMSRCLVFLMMMTMMMMMLMMINISITEDKSRCPLLLHFCNQFSVSIARRVRESRTELRKHMREMKKANPGASCHLQYDKLYINRK